MCRETVHPPNYVVHEKGSGERYHKARHRHNQTHESSGVGEAAIATTGLATGLAIGDVKSCWGWVLARLPLSLGDSV
jgi:hypothetical protein